jgi:hypothetical protein
MCSLLTLEGAPQGLCGREEIWLPAATQNAVQPVSLLLWYLGVTDHGRTGRFGALGGLERAAEIYRHSYRSIWTPWYQGLVVSRAAGQWSTPGVFGTRRSCPDDATSVS